MSTVTRGNLRSGALFSECERYRYRLWRVWDPEKPAACFLLLNPSVADENILDNTLTRCLNFAEAWGYGGMVVTNIFAYRATKPRDMKAQADPIGPDNDYYIAAAARMAGIVIIGWGTHGVYRNRAADVLALLKPFRDRVHSLCVTKNGYPMHPLYLPGNLQPQRWTPW